MFFQILYYILFVDNIQVFIKQSHQDDCCPQTSGVIDYCMENNLQKFEVLYSIKKYSQHRKRIIIDKMIYF